MAAALDRLDFVLPEFTRISWASDAARQIWEPRFRRIRNRWREIEWRSVADGVRECALIAANKRMLKARNPPPLAAGLHVELLPQRAPIAARYGSAINLSMSAGKPAFAVGTAENVGRLRDAVAAEDHDAVGHLLGYPGCCRRFFVSERVERQCVDTAWAMMAADAGDGRNVSVGSRFGVNILWRQLGLRALPHLPCSVDCMASHGLGAAMIETGLRHGYQEEMSWLTEILSWPVEWSALHGIAEVTTPVLRFSTRTDATASKYTIAWRGAAENSAALPQRRAATSRAFQRGLEHAARGALVAPASHEG